VRWFAGLLLSTVLVSAPANADGGGAQAFTPCRACHTLDPAERNLPGPNLSGVIGRTIGDDVGFDYSPVLRKARDEGLRWDAKRLEAFRPIPPRCFRDCGCRCAASGTPPSGRRWCGFSEIPPRAEG